MLVQLCFVVAVLGYLARCQTLHTGVVTWTSISYTRDALLALGHAGPPPLNLPVCVRSSSERNRRHRRRGQQGGIRQRLRQRGNRPPLPSMILCNARSLHGKMEELQANSKACFEYRTSSLMVFTETWLHRDVPDAALGLEGFSLVRADRNAQSGKIRGGGLAVYVSNAWCKQYTIKDTICCPDAEVLCIKIRPFYLPREFGSVVFCAVYVPPSGSAKGAAECIADCVHQQLQCLPEAPVFILGAS